MTSLSTNARTHLLPRNNKAESHHSKQRPSRCFDKDLRSLLLRLHSTNSDSVHFQNGLGALFFISFIYTLSPLRDYQYKYDIVHITLSVET